MTALGHEVDLSLQGGNVIDGELAGTGVASSDAHMNRGITGVILLVGTGSIRMG